MALAQQAERSGPGERADFMMHRRAAVEKESLDHIERRRGQFFEQAKAESLSDGRIDAVEDRVGPGAFDPFGAAFGKGVAAGFGELQARLALSSLQAF